MALELDNKYITENTLTEVVPIEKMFVAKYGRPLMVPKVQAIACNFDKNAVGTIYLSLRSDGQYAILDGQHRIAAARLKGLNELAALVFIDLTYEYEAALYVKFATVNKQTNLDKFKARLEAKEPLALDIVDVLDHVDLSVSFAGQVKDSIQAVGVLESLYKKGGRKHLRDVLTIIHRAWQGEPRAYLQPIMQGMSMFLQRYENLTVKDDGVKLDWNRLVEKLQQMTPEALTAKASQLKGILSQKDSMSVVGQVILYEYNKGLKTSKLPDWVRK